MNTRIVSILLALGLAATLLLPNSQQLVGLVENPGRRRWRPRFGWAMACAGMLCLSFVGMFGATEFIYFQF